ncbi:MAG: hypothetical protein WB679_19240 [Terracidiphilus sp.]
MTFNQLYSGCTPNPSAYWAYDGNLHKFINVFTDSTPTEAPVSWPIAVSTTGGSLASPNYDSVSGNIFVGDYELNLDLSCGSVGGSLDGQCGFLYSVNSETGAVTQSAQFDYNLGIYDVVVDPAAEMVYAFVGADDSTSCSGGSCAAVFQLPPTFSRGASGTEATVGAGYESLFAGSFDNQY